MVVADKGELTNREISGAANPGKQKIEKMKTTTIQLPSFWASFLVNGDGSSLSASEQALVSAHLKALGLRAVDCLSCGDEYFTKTADLGAGSYCDFAFATK